ncbi:SLC13 family permease [Evansella cellulosilytica]|uniref:Citrate transporter n=1 Tax=Evansella cellulosilytica (strain ATCC 21833 / DSM 2522 / FERM P-1141 / JCM 9156 / N-4) TaxID=649639 RepID=E6TUV7_EVAC2|nr:SLC13 family permease [Evansella cellulosilytica]ADU32109.1 Citrate transporter [Evansella cellulosilytica DSM 2522]
MIKMKVTLFLRGFFKENYVVLTAACAAIISSLIVKPDGQYIDYIDYQTLVTLFCMLAIVRGFEEIHFFRILSRRIISFFGTMRTVILALVYITFIGSMIIANDMALITFLPLGYYVLSSTNSHKYVAFTFIMQNIAANLGGMLTPFGNPQNLFMYSFFNINPYEFMSIMFFPFIISIVLITVCCLFVKNEPLVLIDSPNQSVNMGKTILYFVLFGCFIAIIFKLIPYIYGAIIITGVILFSDRKVLIKLDYPLLLTFFFFFIFAGNMSRIDLVRDILSDMLLQNTLVTEVISSQIISNVPSAILLSQFTDNYSDLLVAVNIGGTGTLIASLASLITYREYIKHYPEKNWHFIKLFSIINFSFLITLTTITLFIL